MQQNEADPQRRALLAAAAVFAAGGGLGAGPAEAAGPSPVREPDPGSTLWYGEPARRWVEALPLGNGRLGAMVFGGVQAEHLQLNEDTLWSGAPKDWNTPDAKEVPPQVRAALLAGNYHEADRLCRRM